MTITEIFTKLKNAITANSIKLQEIADKLEQLEVGAGGGGGSGNATIEDYAEGKYYERNTLLVYEETVYRVLTGYTSRNFDLDYHGDGTPGSIKLKIVGFESSIVTFGTEPDQETINNLPQDTLVAIYNSDDEPYNLT